MRARHPYHFRAVLLECAKGHEHAMAPEQATRLEGSPCCWCKQPIWADWPGEKCTELTHGLPVINERNHE